MSELFSSQRPLFSKRQPLSKLRPIDKRKRRLKIIFSKFFFRGLIAIILFCLLILIYVLINYFGYPSRLAKSSSSPSLWPKSLTFPSSSIPTSTDISETADLPVISGSGNLLVRNSDITFGVYFDDFPNSVYIDKKRTTLYHDETATAVFFPPVYDWQNADSSLDSSAADNYFANLALNYFAGPYYDKRCLRNNCLEQKGNNLYYSGQNLAWPKELDSSAIVSVSISALTERWLIGVTLKEGDNYRGQVYYFNGTQFTEIKTPAPLTSFYFGVWGFGGEESDFLMIYGAYEGIAYRVRATSLGDNLTDLSKFFAIRAMGMGFKAEVLKVGQGLNTTWYVYSSTVNRPRLIKLWQNRSPEIVGEAFFPNLAGVFTASGQSVAQSAVFKFLNNDAAEINLLAEIKNQDGSSVRKIFRDRGFNNNAADSLITVPISNDGNNSEIIIKRIAQAKLGLDAESEPFVKYLFSADCQDWRDLPPEKNSDFITPALKSFCLKVVFPGVRDKFYSPYLSSMMFNYYRVGSGG